MKLCVVNQTPSLSELHEAWSRNIEATLRNWGGSEKVNLDSLIAYYRAPAYSL